MNISPIIIKFAWIVLALLMPLSALAKEYKTDNTPDSAYLFAYANDKNKNKNGLHFAWSFDKKKWYTIGKEYSFLKSDYGNWGNEKRMLMPFLLLDNSNVWHCLWSLNEYDGVLAHAASEDLVNWKRQSYPDLMEKSNCLYPEIVSDGNEYIISWVSSSNGTDKHFEVKTTDFKNYSETKEIPSSSYKNLRDKVIIEGNEETGTIHTVSWNLIQRLIDAEKLAAYKNIQNNETTKADAIRFEGLKPIDATILVDGTDSKKISNMLLGIFFEDINYAADGGLYAELVQNRGFEYNPGDNKGRDETWNSKKAWELKGEDAVFSIETASPIHENNKHYAVLDIQNPGARLINEGFGGISIKAGDKYDFSVFARMINGKAGKLTIRLTGKNGEIYGEATTKNISADWKKYEAVITSNQTVNNAQLEIIPQMSGKVGLDMISLFPQKTFKNRKNGLRADLAQVIADMNPRFVRFPGGCVAHGDGIENMYRWKNTIGELEARKPQRNIWGYHQSMGLGYFEYFQFCEDIGAEPIPIIAAGVPCQNSSVGGAGQQGGIPMCEMDDFVQEVLDLIEWANGDLKTTWGKKRAEAGHPKPFNLKYIGIGNEDLITDIFEERFAMIFNAVKEKHPEIIVIGTAGPFYEGTDYVEGWDLAGRLGVPMIDEHYYNPPGWYIHNQDFYDKYDRSKAQVYLGEYAAHLPGRPNNIETALAEAIHLTSLERNGDIVAMSSYAPLLAKDGFTQWNPDLIYFNNTEVKPTVGYYVQKLWGIHAGTEYLNNSVILSNNEDAVKKRVAVSVVKDEISKDIIVKMVNMLPVTVNPAINLKNISVPNQMTEKTVLTGNPDDRKATPETTSINISGNFTDELPPYSLTIIRLKTE